MPVEVDPTILTVESTPLTLGASEEVLAVSAAGGFSSAQVYFIGPDAWITSGVSVRLYGRRGGGRLLLSEVSLDATAHTQEGGTSTALAVTVRGVPVDGFEVVVAQDEHGGSLSDGRIVLVASTQANGVDIRPGLPESLQPVFAQGRPGAQSGRWPVFLSDGSEEVGTVTKPLHVRKSDRRAAYYTSAAVGTGTSSTTNKSILYVWNDRTSKRVEIRRITIAYLAGVGGNLTVKGAHITAEAGTPGGTSITPLPLDPMDAASAMISRAGAAAPTQVAVDLLRFAVPFSATGVFTWTWADLGKPIVLSGGDFAGFEVRVDVSAAATTEMMLHVSIEWLEI